MKQTHTLLIIFMTASCPYSTYPMVSHVLKRAVTLTVGAGIGYFGLTNDSKKTRTIIREAAQKISDHTTKTIENVQTWLEQQFVEQKDEHALMINILAELQKQNKRLKAKQTTTLEELNDLKNQQAATLEEIHTLKIMIAALEQLKSSEHEPMITRLPASNDILVKTEEAD